MKKIIMMICLIMLCSGCLMTSYTDKAYDKEGNITHKASFCRGSLFSITTFEDAEVDYNGIKFKLTNYKNKGDTASLESVGKMVTYGLIAYSSMGSIPAMEALLAALKAGEVDRVVGKYEKGEEVTDADFPIALQYMLRKKDNK